MGNLDDTDPTFVEDLEESKVAVWHVARWLSGLGYNVTVRPVFLRPDPSQRVQFADHGDLEIIQRVEVKHRRDLYFTGAHDFPYPSLIVDVAHAWDNARPKPYAYVILNADMTTAALVKAASQKHWVRVNKWDRRCNRARTFYECPLYLVQFMVIPAGCTVEGPSYAQPDR